MSRAFLNEDKFEQAADALVERPISPHPNVVTPTGLEQLQARVTRLEKLRDALARQTDDPFALQRKAEAERDLRYYAAQLERAILVDPATQPADEVRFGATVAVTDENGARHRFTLVGEDEADAAHHKVSWVSPLARALAGHKAGESVVWQRPAGPLELEILDIRYTADAASQGNTD